MRDIHIISEVEVSSSVGSGKTFLFSLVMGALLFGGGAVYATSQLFIGNQEVNAIKLWFMAIAGWSLVAIIIYLVVRTMIAKNTAYVPGKSFTMYRWGDGLIYRIYNIVLWVGISAFLVGFVGYVMGYGGMISLMIGGGISAYLGYRGRISKDVHEDIDYVAVEILRGAGLISREKVYASYQNFDPSEPDAREKGDFVIGVLADGIVILLSDGTGWRSARKKFSNINGIGFFGGNSNSVHIKMSFSDGDKYGITIDPSLGMSTEALTFSRQLLKALDASLMSESPEQTGAHRRRIVVNGDDVEENAAGGAVAQETANVQKAFEPVASGRVLELANHTVAEIKTVTPIEEGRSLELEF